MDKAHLPWLGPQEATLVNAKEYPCTPVTGKLFINVFSGNTEAFAELVEKYKARIFALVYAKVGQFQDAEDLTQDVFFNAYKKTLDAETMGQFLCVASFKRCEPMQGFSTYQI